MASALATFERLRDDLFRYYDTPFRVRLDGVMRERRALLDRPAIAWQEPWLEVMRQYEVTGASVANALQQAALLRTCKASCDVAFFEALRTSMFISVTR